MTNFPSSASPDSVSSFLAFIEETKRAEMKNENKADFIFRGQSIDESLIPRIARLTPNGKRGVVEQLILREFARLSLDLSTFEQNDEWDILALAQHHGLPTRLLDWSYSALAALWFCVKKPPRKEKNKKLNGVVWLIKTLPEDFINLPKQETPYTLGKTRIFRPRPVSPRVVAQSGVFTCHELAPAGVCCSLESDKTFNGRLLKITIPADCFEDILKQLFLCGVTNFSLFPDLGGLAGHLKHRYFHYDEPKH